MGDPEDGGHSAAVPCASPPSGASFGACEGSLRAWSQQRARRAGGVYCYSWLPGAGRVPLPRMRSGVGLAWMLRRAERQDMRTKTL